jgi:hypothetical protein
MYPVAERRAVGGAKVEMELGARISGGVVDLSWSEGPAGDWRGSVGFSDEPPTVRSEAVEHVLGYVDAHRDRGRG